MKPKHARLCLRLLSGARVVGNGLSAYYVQDVQEDRRMRARNSVVTSDRQEAIGT